MDTRTISARPDVAIVTTSARVTPTPPRATRFGEVLSNTVVQSAKSAMSKLPGSPMMAVAVRNATGSSAVSAPMQTMSSPMGPVPSSVGGAISSPTGTSAAGGADGGGIDATLQQSQDMNLYYLQVQEAMSAQNREYSALSNILKAKHDTVKTAIGNIR